MGRKPDEEQEKWEAAVALLDEAKRDLLHTIEAAEAALQETDDGRAGPKQGDGR